MPSVKDIRRVRNVRSEVGSFNKKTPRSCANRNEAGTAGQMAIQCGK